MLGLSDPAKPGGKMTPKQQQQGKPASSLMGGSAPNQAKAKQQSSIRSFFQAKPSTPGMLVGPAAATPEKRTGVTPMMAALDALNKIDNTDTIDMVNLLEDGVVDEVLGMDEAEFIRPVSGKKSRIVRDEDEDENEGDAMMEALSQSSLGAAHRLPSSPQMNSTPVTSAARKPPSVPASSPLAKRAFKPAVAPKKSALSMAQDAEDDMDGGRGEARYDWLANPRDANKNRVGSEAYDPRSLYIPPSAWQRFTPFERQFWEIKSRLMDTIVFFKKGKFYELYEGDADVGARLFDLKMTDRVNMRMVGVPEATFDMWVGRFVAAGHRIARVDQTETAISKGMKDRASSGKADKIIKRELSQILTSGTLVDPRMLAGREQATYCMALCQSSSDESTPTLGVAFVDAAAAVFRVAAFQDDASAGWPQLATLLLQVRPRELILPKGMISPDILRLVRAVVPEASVIQAQPVVEFWDAQRTLGELDHINAGSGDLSWTMKLREAAGESATALSACGALLWYLKELRLDGQLLARPVFESYDPVRSADRLVLDAPTLANLDVLPQDSTGKSSGSLLGLLDRCCTPMGRRTLRLWVCHPLRRPTEIEARLDSVDTFLGNSSEIMAPLQKRLSSLPDLERLLGRVCAGAARVPDFLALLDGLQAASGALAWLSAELAGDPRAHHLLHLCGSHGAADTSFAQALAYFNGAFDREAAKRDGCILPAPGVHPGYDAAQGAISEAQRILADHLKEKEALLRCSGQLRYRDLGKELYQLEVPARISIPASCSDFLLLSKTKAVNRYWTPVIKEQVRLFQEAEVRRSGTPIYDLSSLNLL